MTRISEERCDTTLTMRYWIDNCDCGCYPDNLGPCTTWIAGPDGRCPYCAHTIECHAKLATRLDRELRAYRKEGWQPIETAKDQSVLPWNGESVLICTNHNWGDRVHKARWTDEIHGEGIFSWAVDDCKHGPYPLRGYTQVTHWMPLPAAPEPQEDSCD